MKLLWATVVLSVFCVVSCGQDVTDDSARVGGTVASAVNGQLLPCTRVFLRRTGQNSFVVWSDADDYGHFLFKSVDEGSYEIAAEKTGFFTDKHKTANQVLDVKARDHIAGVVLRPVPLAVVSERITNDHDDPLPNALVRLLAKEYLHGRELLNNAGVATTDDRGEYRIFGIHPGNYYLVAEYDARKAHPSPFSGVPIKGSPTELAYPPLFYPLTSDLRQAQRITVAAGAEMHFDFAFLSVPSVSLEGRVLNGMTGEPAREPNVVAYWGDRITGITRKVEVNAKGDFKLDGIEPGPYTLVATMSQNGENYSDFHILEVGLSGLKEVQLALMPDFNVKGQVRFENAGDNPLHSLPRHVSVEFMPLQRNTGSFRAVADLPARQQATSAIKNGALEFEARLHPGEPYEVGLPNLPQDYYLRSILVDGHEVSPSNIAIEGNNSELVLVASPAGGHIEGLTRNGSGQPASSHVLLVPNVDRLTPELVRSVDTDRQGKFVLRGVTPGDYKLYAWEELDLNELLGQLDMLKSFEGECQPIHVDEDGTYNPEVRVIAAK